MRGSGSGSGLVLRWPRSGYRTLSTSGRAGPAPAAPAGSSHQAPPTAFGIGLCSPDTEQTESRQHRLGSCLGGGGVTRQELAEGLLPEPAALPRGSSEGEGGGEAEAPALGF